MQKSEFNPVAVLEEARWRSEAMQGSRTLPWNGWFFRLKQRFGELLDDYATWRNHPLLRAEKISALVSEAFKEDIPLQRLNAMALHPERDVRHAALERHRLAGGLAREVLSYLRSEPDPEIRKLARSVPRKGIKVS